MSFNNRNLNPNIWDCRNSQPFGNNPSNFFPNNNSSNFPRQNFNPQQHFNKNQIRPLLNISVQPPLPQEPRNFNRNRPGPACRTINNNNFLNPPNPHHSNNKWNINRKDDRDFTGDSPNNNNGERSKRRDSFNESPNDTDSRPKSLVEQLKSTMKKNSTSQNNSADTNESIDACARNASKKFFSQLKTMDRDNVKELINNPKQPHRKAVMSIQAREKLREVVKKQLKTLGSGAEDQEDVTFDVEESVNCENIPETLIAQIGRTVDIDLNVEDMDLQNEIEDEAIVDKDMEVVEKNLGNDFLFGSEMLLMNGFSLLGESEHETESDIKLPDDNRLLPPPPLPSEPISKPPEPVPPPNESVDAAFSSSNKPWTVVTPKTTSQRLNEDFEMNSSRNPDPPPSFPMETQPIQVIVSQPVVQSQILPAETLINTTNIIDVSNKVQNISLPENLLLAAVKTDLPEKLPISKITVSPLPHAQQIKIENTNNLTADKEQQVMATPNINMTSTPVDQAASANVNQSQNDSEMSNVDKNGINNFKDNDQKQRANETYGDYKRRILGMEKSRDDNNFNKPRPRSQQRRDYDDDDRSSRNADNNSWISNKMRNNNNNGERKSRFEMNRGRNKNQKNDRRNYENNSSAGSSRDRDRDRNNQWDRRRDDRDEEMKDAFNYRFNNSSVDADPDRLSNILKPKQMQFKGSFNKRTGFNHNNIHRSPSRERTPANNSVEREFADPSSIVSDVRPCYHTLKKIIEIDNELSKIHDKIHGIDKVIANLQSERVTYQKNVTRMMHDRKVLFDNLLKRSMMNETSPSERQEPKEKKKRRITDDDEDKPSQSANNTPSTPCKSLVNKKLQDILDQKKRKNDETTTSTSQTTEEEIKKKKKFDLIEEPKTAHQKQREEEEKQRNKRIEEIRRQKQERLEKKARDQRRLEEQNMKLSNDFIPVIRKDPRDKSVDITKGKSEQQQSSSKTKVDKSEQSKDVDKMLIKFSDAINPANYTIKKFDLKLKTVTLDEKIIEQFKTHNYPEFTIEDWTNMSNQRPINNSENREKSKEKEKGKKATEEVKVKNEDIKPKVNEHSAEKDPLAIDEHDIINPPTTPGSHLTMDDDDVSMASSNANDIDYSEWAGLFEAHTNPIVYLQNIDGRYMVCASECGKLYKYRLKTGKCEAVFSTHTEICNSFLFSEREQSIYTASSDGKSYRVKFKSFISDESKDFNEPLQIIEKSKYFIYVGAKSGKIFKIKFDMSGEDEPLCCVDSFLLCMKASKEGSRHILIVSSRNNPIQIRDANEGLLLRTLSNDLANVNIYDMLIEGSTIYCGSNLHEIFAIDFTTGALKSKRSMSGAGAICVKLFKEYLIAACYDGNIYIFNIKNDDDAVNIAGPSKMILSMDLWNNKIIASTKDTTLKIMNIPT
ncbi:hypothetical protein PVAND_002713 [Polypedilum vanderplanki]|uniref:Uncharacterized protein n=1 Tax=Polypedilum vanderplanki TaxID=319348 RepID=A0A9J6BSL0_POLVA|nr:hypothetical protein PVAND_002713 [Polypedilum vanderplanki]